MFGDKLKELRKLKNLTQVDIANMCEVTPSTVSAWEVNKAQPNFDILTTLAEYFRVSTDYLLGREQVDSTNIEKLTRLMKEAGMMVGDNLTIEELEKALQIVEMMRERT